MDLVDNQAMPDAKDHQEACAERHAPTSALVPNFARHGRPDTRYKMELGDQLSAFIVGVCLLINLILLDLIYFS